VWNVLAHPAQLDLAQALREREIIIIDGSRGRSAKPTPPC
jgi:hypothetical protein